MISSIFLIIFICIISIFIIHFIGLYISQKIRKTNKGWGINLGKHIELSVTSDPSLIVHKYHYYKWYYEEEMSDKTKFSHNINMIIGGFSIRIKYGHIPIDKPDDYSGDFCKSTHYGFYSIDGEKLWSDFYWGKHMYNNPFAPMHFLGCWYFDVNNGKLINQKDTTDYGGDTIIPCIRIDENTYYINKHNTKNFVPKITWHLEERRWTLPILNWLKLSWLYNRKHVDLEFNCSGTGDAHFNGLGIEGYGDKCSDSWKGGVWGAGLNLNEYPKILGMYNRISKGELNELSRFKYVINNLIDDFMFYQKKY